MGRRPGAEDARDAVDVRTMLASAGVMSLVANQFLFSSAVTAYYTVGAGSLQLASGPAWIGDTYDLGSASGADGGAFGGGSTAEASAGDSTGEASEDSTGEGSAADRADLAGDR